MSPPLGRRGALMLALVAAPWPAAGQPDALAAAIREQIGAATPEEGGIALRAPAVAENGGQVPITILVDSPQTEAAHVTAIHIFATRNPTPGVASFRLGAAIARAEVQTRIRVAEDQQILVYAELNDGTVRRAAADIRVTTGGCLT
jgi:sulfur-oxidizing protein SoxY